MPASKRDVGSDAALGYARPGTYEELLAVLASAAATMPKRLRQVAVFLTQHPHNVALGTISTVAEEIGVQPSTLVRFAQMVGYAGFSDFQELFKAHLKSGLADGAGGHGMATASRDADAPRGPLPAFLAGLVTAARASLLRLGDDFDAVAFDRMANLLSGAGMIYLIGAKRAFPVVSYMSLTFSQHGIRNVLVDNIGASAQDLIGCVGPGDMVLAVSFSPYNSTTPELARIAVERGARLVAITDSMLSPLLPLAEARLVVVEPSEGGYRSLAATMVAGLGLVVAVAGLRAPADAVRMTPAQRRAASGKRSP